MSRQDANGALAVLTIATVIVCVLTVLMLAGVIESKETYTPAQDPPAFVFTR